MNRFGTERTAGDIVIRVDIESSTSCGRPPSDSELMRTPKQHRQADISFGLDVNRQMRS